MKCLSKLILFHCTFLLNELHRIKKNNGYLYTFHESWTTISIFKSQIELDIQICTCVLLPLRNIYDFSDVSWGFQLNENGNPNIYYYYTKEDK